MKNGDREEPATENPLYERITVSAPPEKTEEQKWMEEKFRQLKDEYASLLRENTDYAAQARLEKELRASLEGEKDDVHPRIQPLPSTERDGEIFLTEREKAVRLFDIQGHDMFLTKPTEELRKLSQSLELKLFELSREKDDYLEAVCEKLMDMKEKHLAIRLHRTRTDIRNVRRLLNGEQPSPDFIRFSSRCQGGPQRRMSEEASPVKEEESPPIEERRKEKDSLVERNARSDISVVRNGERKREPQRPRVTVKIRLRPKPAGPRNAPLPRQAFPQSTGSTSEPDDDVHEAHMDEERNRKGREGEPKNKQALSNLEGATIVRTTWDSIVTFSKKYCRVFNILYGLLCATWEIEKVALKRKKKYHSLFKASFYFFLHTKPFPDILDFEGLVPVIERRLNKMFARYRNVITERVEGASSLSAKAKARVLKALDTCCGEYAEK